MGVMKERGTWTLTNKQTNKHRQANKIDVDGAIDCITENDNDESYDENACGGTEIARMVTCRKGRICCHCCEVGYLSGLFLSGKELKMISGLAESTRSCNVFGISRLKSTKTLNSSILYLQWPRVIHEHLFVRKLWTIVCLSHRLEWNEGTQSYPNLGRSFPRNVPLGYCLPIINNSVLVLLFYQNKAFWTNNDSTVLKKW